MPKTMSLYFSFERVGTSNNIVAYAGTYGGLVGRIVVDTCSSFLPLVQITGSLACSDLALNLYV